MMVLGAKIDEVMTEKKASKFFFPLLWIFTSSFHPLIHFVVFLQYGLVKFQYQGEF